MPRGWFFALSLGAAAACTALADHQDDTASAALFDTASVTTLFDAIDEQIYLLPTDVPDELLDIANPYYARETTSLEEATVTSAWITTAGPDGTPSAMIYRCARDRWGAYRWTATPDAWLAPIDVSLVDYPDLAPFTARYTGAQVPGHFFGSFAASVFTLDTVTRAHSSLTLPSRSQLVGVEEITCPGASLDDLPLARIRRTNSTRLGLYADATMDRADYVLRLNTQGGAGPGAGTDCVPGEMDLRVPFDAELWFVRVGFIPAEKPSQDGGAGGGSDEGSGGGP